MSNKPLFSTSEPGFMGSIGDVFHLHLKGDKSIYETDNMVSAYFDGDLETAMGYDIPYLLSGDMTGDDLQKCQAITPEGEYLSGCIKKVKSDISGRDLFYIVSDTDCSQ